MNTIQKSVLTVVLLSFCQLSGRLCAQSEQMTIARPPVHEVYEAPSAYDQAMGIRRKFVHQVKTAKDKSRFEILAEEMLLTREGMLNVRLSDGIPSIVQTRMPEADVRRIFARYGPEWWENVNGWEVVVKTMGNGCRIGDYDNDLEEWVWSQKNLSSIEAEVKLVERATIKQCFNDFCKYVEKLGRLHEDHGSFRIYNLGNGYKYVLNQGVTEFTIEIARDSRLPRFEVKSPQPLKTEAQQPKPDASKPLTKQEDLKLTIAAPDTMALGQNVRISFTINTQDVESINWSVPDETTDPWLTISYGPSTSTQSSYKTLNGVTTSTQSKTITYIVTPQKTGWHVIPPAKAVTPKGRATESPAKTVLVVK